MIYTSWTVIVPRMKYFRDLKDLGVIKFEYNSVMSDMWNTPRMFDTSKQIEWHTYALGAGKVGR